MGGTELWRGRYLAVREVGGWEHVVRVGASGVVAVVPITDEDELVLVEQRRPPVGATVIELPAGLAGDVPDHRDEALLDAARRELLEETGFEASRWQLVADGPTSAGLSDEQVHLFVARGLTRAHAGGGEPGEGITVHVVPLAEVQRWLRAARARGAHVDHKVLTGLLLAGVPWDGQPLARP